ncbi:YceI family protein [Ichthyenterobacterium magnum]|uniref:YceI-like domain-containing protein n=1 Tax=Ichthyenterobacterium magnum TaxID=1230530 RepID=A0A420DLF9_9FLAO|nr:YceI family protein [Ichthyenterobacterium magnum]RKE94999.1 YceI-like domain-containing protein [Ichthyenterobacterium magnum]
MKHLIYILLLISISSFSQSKYYTKVGLVAFEASVPSFEEVKAKNTSTTAILNTENGEFAALLLVKGFRFKNALMEEHFNENYAESDTYPKAIFKGKIVGFSSEELNQNSKHLSFNGELTFHGISKKLESISIDVKRIGNIIYIKGHFEANASDYEIKIPKIVRNKVSEAIKVSFEFELNQK